MISAPALQFKGSGWYVTDYAKNGKSPSTTGGNKSEGKGEGSSESKSENKSESKPENTAKKPAPAPASTSSEK
jgi:predicted nucleic acid-binding Zn ribbon protein